MFFKNKVVIITGGSSGIGRACAQAFAQAGAHVVITGRNEARLNATASVLRQTSAQVLPLVADVSEEEDCRRVVETTLRKWGGVDVLINNAGISMRALFADLDLEVLHRLMNTNFWGTVYMTKAALPYLLNSQGSVVGISSIAGYRGLPARTGYSASKAAMQGFFESLRTETLHQGLHVLVACPGFTTSNIRNVALAADGHPQGETPRDEQKMMSAEEVAQRLVEAVQHRRRDLILTTQGKMTVFMNKWLPGWMDKMVYKHFAKEADSPLK
ncbi:Short-chain dehydrogenase [Catalinimonas alkaloidigena]|uniref:Short-chain dehydrogenase n=1 Tax=Catalinimonas alkaloidigena TaxID=1075417 RepID=A0A1G9U4F3_9BACT|nr:SDR family oxidoreductase [Catalinimonas alkaloidigena]SDM54900.1 Short-chain dehydrogenase [Catalinimonas alkaloidigena]